MVRIDEAEAKEPVGKWAEPTHLEDRNSNLCPGCGGRLGFWACEALCHNCGLKFTCDE